MLDLLDSGPRDGEAIVFLHGFPDDASLWDLQIPAFEDRYRCVRLVLPNYGGRVDAPEGVDFEAMVERIDATLISPTLGLPPRVHLVAHDWGAAYAYLYADTHPARLASLTTLDVGGSIGPQPSPMGYLVFPAYQLTLAAAFALTRTWGPAREWAERMTRASIGRLEGPAGFAGPSRAHPVTPYLNYPYFFFWKRLLTEGIPRFAFPDLPLFYAYGTEGVKKVLCFHDDRWLEDVRRSPFGRAVAFERSSHWLMRDEPEKLNRELAAFFEAVEGGPAPPLSGLLARLASSGTKTTRGVRRAEPASATKAPPWRRFGCAEESNATARLAPPPFR